jgi:hypothetical protein
LIPGLDPFDDEEDKGYSQQADAANDYYSDPVQFPVKSNFFPIHHCSLCVFKITYRDILVNSFLGRVLEPKAKVSPRDEKGGHFPNDLRSAPDIFLDWFS